MKMSRGKRKKVLENLTPESLKELSVTYSCAADGLATPHERIMWAAGFRKGLKQALQDTYDDRKGQLRRNRGGPHAVWARGFMAGKKFVPVDLVGLRA